MRGILGFFSNPLPALAVLLTIVMLGFATFHLYRTGEAAGKLVTERTAQRDLAVRERDGVIHWADVVCGIVQAPFRETKRETWGLSCGNAILRLADLEKKNLSATNTVLNDERAKRIEKQERDLAALRRQNASMTVALKQLAEAKANVKDDVYGPLYFGGLNLAAGLQPPRETLPDTPVE